MGDVITGDGARDIARVSEGAPIRTVSPGRFGDEWRRAWDESSLRKQGGGEVSRASTVEIIGGLRAGELWPGEITVAQRRRCVAYLGREGYPDAEIRKILSMGRHALARDLTANRDGGRLPSGFFLVVDAPRWRRGLRPALAEVVRNGVASIQAARGVKQWAAIAMIARTMRVNKKSVRRWQRRGIDPPRLRDVFAGAIDMLHPAGKNWREPGKRGGPKCPRQT